MKDDDDDLYAPTPRVSICPTCRRIVYRTDGHRCDVLRDYEWMRGHR